MAENDKDDETTVMKKSAKNIKKHKGEEIKNGEYKKKRKRSFRFQ